MTRRIGSACALALALALSLTAGAATAVAGTSTTTFTSTGAEQTYTVPAGVTEISVVVTGGRGGYPDSSATGTPGPAATITGALTVYPGQVLYLEVGGTGGTGSAGFNGGGTHGSGYSGGGGGASDIRTLPRAAGSQSLLSRVLVAGGGGGAGYNATGGNAGLTGAARAGATNGTPGGTGATLSAGGTGGSTSCAFATSGGNGDLGSGGAAGSYHAGGGGGGYYGGGGGGGWSIYCPFSMAAGGGGGGTSYIAPGASGTIAQAALTDAPTIAITVPTPEADTTTSSLTFAAQRAGSVSASQPVTITNSGDAPLHVSGLVFTGANADDFLLGADDCRVAIPVGGSCTAQVRYAPQAAGSSSATLEVASNADGGPLAVALSGEAVEAPAGPQGADGAAGQQGAQGPAGAAGPEGRAGRDIDALRCIRTRVHRGVRTFLCHVVGARFPKVGASVRLTRSGKTIAGGTVQRHNRLLLRTRRPWLTDGGMLVFGDGRRVVRLA